MNAQVKLLLVFGIALIISVNAAIYSKRKKLKESGMYTIYSSHDVINLFPQNATQIAQLTQQSIHEARKKIEEIIAIAPEKRTYENTAHAFDALCSLSGLSIAGNTIEILELVSPDEQIRTAAHEAVLKMQEFAVDAISNNKALYNAFKEYALGNANAENLTQEQRYYLKKTMEDFKRGGMDLPDDKLEAVKTLKKELAALELKFSSNIAQDNRTIALSAQGLAGVDADFLNSLKRGENETYIVGVDYPTYFTIMENCIVPETRARVFEMFQNRAYPMNEQLINDIIAKRDALAKMLGYASYSDYDISDQMVASAERAHSFIDSLSQKALVKEKMEFDELLTDLPASVQLTKNGKLQPWDVMFAKNQFKKKYYNIDEAVIAEYFPMEKTVRGLLDIYEQFFSITFKERPLPGMWHEDVSLVEVTRNDGSLLGYLLLDLYPRPNKYSHACHVTISPATYVADKPNCAVSLVIANFPKSTATKPSLLKRKDVSTFFHEFGHALHALLGRTAVSSLAGTQVKRDFVEMPSQMLEEWLLDRAILKKVSAHYKTGEPLSDSLIDNIIRVKNFSTGAFVQTQLFYSRLSLDCFGQGNAKDVHALYNDLYRTMRPYTELSPNDHMYVSFGHLTGYGAKYYGYMWSKVFALDLFQEIKKHGLLNPEIGKKYVECVIGKGGSEDPNILLKNFLGREPNQEAFLHDLGL